MEPSQRERRPDWLREIDHTGDIGIAVDAEQLPKLFERAAWGMLDVLTDLAAVQPRRAHAVTAEAANYNELMVKWLSELNFLHVTQQLLFSRFTLEELEDHRLSATVWGEPIDPDRHTVYTEIKAITYHGLDVHQDDDGWHVQIIFDM